jgi:dimethylamine monooxygenase subunit A
MPASFSVAGLAPFRGGRGALRVGLGEGGGGEWGENGPGLAARTAAKRLVFATEPDSLAVLPEAGRAIAELAALLDTPPSLRDAALATFEDLALLLPDGPSHRLVAAAIAFPTDWDLPAKIGHPLAHIHAPIPTYATRLEAGVDHVFAQLTPDRLLLRANWNVLETDQLRYLPGNRAIERFGHVTAANAGDTLFVRVERQVLRRLPVSGAALFSIGVYIEPLGALPPELVADLATAVAGLPDAEANRRGTPAYRDALSAWAVTRR